VFSPYPRIMGSSFFFFHKLEKILDMLKINILSKVLFVFIAILGFSGCGIITPKPIGCTPGPNNTHAFLAYSSVLSSGASEVFRVEFNNTLNTQVSHLIQGNLGSSLPTQVLIPTNILMISDSGGKSPQGLYSIKFDGTGLTKIIPYNYQIVSAVWNQNLGNYIILYQDCSSCPASSNYKLGVYNFFSSTFKNIGNAYSHVDVSLDGKTLYFDYVGASLVPHIYSVQIDGTGLTQLTNSTYGEEYPAISPDGSTVAIASYMNSTHTEQEICFMKPDGTNLHQITKLSSTTIAHQPCWSPLNDQIFFSCYDKLNPAIPSHIFSAGIDGSNIQKFTSGNGETHPCAGFMNEF